MNHGFLPSQCLCHNWPTVVDWCFDYQPVTTSHSSLCLGQHIPQPLRWLRALCWLSALKTHLPAIITCGFSPCCLAQCEKNPPGQTSIIAGRAHESLTTVINFTLGSDGSGNISPKNFRVHVGFFLLLLSVWMKGCLQIIYFQEGLIVQKARGLCQFVLSHDVWNPHHLTGTI